MLRYVVHDTAPSGKAVSDIVAENDLAVWKEIPGYYYRYRISDWGTVQKYLRGSGTWKTLNGYLSGGKKLSGRRLAVKLTVAPGVRKNIFVCDLMADIFMGGRKSHSGLVLSYKNRDRHDCSLVNLEWITREEAGRRAGGQGRKSVEKIDKDGNVVDLFRSVTECCEREYISHKTLWRIMTRQVKNPFATTGYDYRFEEDAQ